MAEQPPSDNNSDFGPLNPRLLGSSQDAMPQIVDAIPPEASPVNPCQQATEAATPISGSGEPAGAATPRDPERLQLVGEIARGGMGAVLKGRDLALGRDIAVKVLLEDHADKPEFARRFVEEARIAGQLQHPGVAPVYELGVLADERPYFTMKLVKGQTLAALLAARTDLPAERPRFLGIFAQVCQTLAYAHARGVIHRDLKPSNIMVGAFGEVQVMDWGLAKVLTEGGAAEAGREQERAEDASVIRTQRAEEAEGSYTQAGMLLGTPAYMAPEQARGDVELVDERADVFGLGAILCEVLTGAPPFVGKGAEATRKAQTGQLEDAYVRLDGCGADAELIALAKRCLAAEPWQRPRQAAEVAEAITAYQGAVAERLRQAELERTAAQIKAQEEGKRRRLAIALAAAVLLLVLLGGGGWLWRRAERQARLVQTNREVHEAINQARTLREQGRTAQGRAALELAAQARAQAQRAESLLDSRESDAELAAQVRGLLAELHEDEKDRQLLAALEAARLTPMAVNVQAHTYTRAQAVPLYREAFRVYGMPAGEGKAEDVAARLEKHPAVREAVLAALDEWILLAERTPRVRGEEPHLDWLRAVRASVAPEGWRKQVLDAAEEKDRTKRRAALEKLAESADVNHLPAHALTMLAKYLRDAGSAASALSLLRRARVPHADDFWINADLGQALRTKPNQRAEAVRYLTAAVALHPDSYVARLNLAETLLDLSRLYEAAAECRKVIELEPRYARAYYVLGVNLVRQGKPVEALVEFDKTLAINPRFRSAANSIRSLMAKGGKLDEAVAASRNRTEAHPKDALAHYNFGNVLALQDKLDEAVAEYQKALALDAKNARTHIWGWTELVQAFARQGRLEQHRVLWQKIVEGNPPDHESWYGYAELCLFLGRDDDYRRARTDLLARFSRSTDPQVAERAGRTCLLLPASGDEWRQANALIDNALAAGPKHYLYHYFQLAKGLAVYRNDRPEQAIPLLRESAAHIQQLTPRLVLAMAQYRCGRQEEARQTLAAAIAAYHWDEARAANEDGWIYHILRREAEELMVPNLSAFLKGQYQPRDNKERLELIGHCRFRKRYLTAARMYADAFVADAKLADNLKAAHRYNAACCAALAGAGQGEESKKLHDKERARWRHQAVAWLRADLTANGKLLSSGKAADRTLVQQRLQHWRQDGDLLGIRNAKELAKLSAEERQACERLWADLMELLEHAKEK